MSSESILARAMNHSTENRRTWMVNSDHIFRPDPELSYFNKFLADKNCWKHDFFGKQKASMACFVLCQRNKSNE